MSTSLTKKRKKPVYSEETLRIKREAMKKTHEFNRGRKLTEEHKANLRKNHVGITGQTRSAETKKKISDFHKGKVWRKGFELSEEHKAKIAWANSHPTMETRIKKSNSSKKRVKEGTHPFGDGTKTAESKLIRESFEYRLWREAVFTRDNWTCQHCKERGGNIQADHIKPFSVFPELRLAIDNGRTLCRDCHKKTDTWGYRVYNVKYE